MNRTLGLAVTGTALFALGCGEVVTIPADVGATSSGNTGGGHTGGSGSGLPFGGGAGSGGAPTEGTGGAPTDCAAAATAIAMKAGDGASCTTVVRFNADPSASSVMVGYAMICGAPTPIDEGAALQQAITDLHGGLCSALSVTGDSTSDEWVFFAPASAAACACCGSGGVMAVSARNAQTVVAGTIEFDASGGLVVPAAWGSPDDLGLACPSPVTRLPPARGFDLTMVQPPTPPPPLADEAMATVLKDLWNTALPAGLEATGLLYDIVVLAYEPQQGNSGSREWLALVNSGPGIK